MFGPKGWPDRALKHHITFNDGTGIIAKNRVREADAVLTSTIEGDWVTGKISSAMNFGGVNQFARITDTDTTDFFSIGLWVNASSIPVGSNDAIVAKQDGTGVGRSWILITQAASINVFIGGNAILTGFTVVPGTFFHVGVTYNNGDIRVFINGAFVNSAPRTEEDATGDYLVAAAKNFSTFADVIVDDLRIYDRVLSDAEMAALASLGI